MDLQKLDDGEKLKLTRRYFYAGFAFLPFLWLVNGIWFFKEACCRAPFPQQMQIRSYVIRSIVGCILWTGAFVAWICVFQTHRVQWGETGDDLTFIFPKGRP